MSVTRGSMLRSAAVHQAIGGVIRRGMHSTAWLLREDRARKFRTRPRHESQSWPRKNAPTLRPTGRPLLDERAKQSKWDSSSVDVQDSKLAAKLDYKIHIGASAAKMEEIQPGDFVEVRRTGRTFSGVVLPIPEDQDSSGSGHGASLAVVVISGVLELVRSTDVMLQFPNFVGKKMALDAAPLKRDYVAASTARVSAAPVAIPEEDSISHEELLALRQSASSDNSFMEAEPLDLARFERRAWICRKIRHLQRETDQEIQRIYPAFRALFLQEQMEGAEGDLSRYQDTPEHKYLEMGLELLHRGSFTTIEATQLLIRYLTFLAKGKEEIKERFRGETIFAMHSLFMNHPKQFLVDSTTHRHSQMFTYRSLHEQQIISRVSSWARASMAALGPGGLEDAAVMQNYDMTEAVAILDGFCERAQLVIQWHEQNREMPPNSDGKITTLPGPFWDDGSLLEWTSTDKDIIEFLKISVGNRRELQDDPTGSVAMSIIKRVGAHVHLEPIVHPTMENVHPHKIPPKVIQADQPVLSDTETSILSAGTDLQHALVFNFLIRLGALTPWEDPNTLDTYLKNVEENANQNAALHAKSRTRLELDSKEEKERHDFHDLPVYVIDSATAHELDDGISIEHVREGECWIHIHVADPSARIPPDHPLALEAQQKYSSIYFPEIQWPLFPDFATYEGMSLRNQSNDGAQKQRVMTFSARLAEDSGKVLDFQWRPAFVRNVHTLNYDEVNHFFSHKKIARDCSSSLKSEHTQRELKSLAQMAGKLLARRVRFGNGVNAGNLVNELSMNPLPLPILASKTLDKPKFFNGFPDIQLQLTDPNLLVKPGTFDGLPGGISSETMVSEMMLLAGRVAASFSAEHEIPMPYRLQDAPEVGQIAIIDKLKDPVTGSLPITELQKRDIFMSPGYFSTKPGRHYGLGIVPMDVNSPDSDALCSGGYIRVTSPLRRYTDLLSHYQLKTSKLDRSILNHTELALQFPRFERMEAWVKQIERSSHRFWIWTYIDRLLKKKKSNDEAGITSDETYTSVEKHLLGPMPAFVGVPDVRLTYDTLQAKIRVNLLSLGGFPVDCTWDPQLPPPPRGQILQVKINDTISAGIKRAINCSPL